MAVRIAPQHTAASTRLPLTRRIRFPRHGCYGLWAARIPSRHGPADTHAAGFGAGLVVAPGWPLAASGGQRLAITGISGFATPAESDVAPSTGGLRRPDPAGKNCARPRLSTPPTPPGASGTGASDGRSVSCSTCFCSWFPLPAQSLVPVVHALLLYRRAACGAF